MSSGTATRVGSQRPTRAVEPPRAYTDGDNAVELSRAYAFEPDERQADIVDCWLGRDEDGDLTAMTCGVTCPRQNGKNGTIESFELFMLLNVPQTHILHTAHQVKTMRKAFLRLSAIFENPSNPELAEETKVIRHTNGLEAIELKNGNTIEYSARSRGAARGFDAITCVVYDEAQELTEEQVEAIMSTLAASPTGDRQVIYAGTPPSPKSPGEVFRKVRAKALSDEPPKGVAWHEWGISAKSCPVTEGMTYEDVREMVFETNPAMGIRLSDEFTEQEFATMTPDGFARERLGWWDSDERHFDAALSAEKWDACGVGEAPEEGKTSIGVKFAPEGDRAAIAACRTPRGGAPYVELVDDVAMPGGLAQIADWLAERKDRFAEIGIDGKAYSGALRDELVKRGVSRRMIRVLTADNVCAAASMLASGVENGTVAHPAGEVEDALGASAKGAAKRSIGSSGGWALGDGSERSYPLEAASIALWTNETTKRDPGRRVAIW